MIWRVKLLHHQVGSRFCKGWKGLGVAGKLLMKKKKKKTILIFLGSIPVFGIAVDGCCEILGGCSSFHAWKRVEIQLLNF